MSAPGSENRSDARIGAPAGARPEDTGSSPQDPVEREVPPQHYAPSGPGVPPGPAAPAGTDVAAHPWQARPPAAQSQVWQNPPAGAPLNAQGATPSDTAPNPLTRVGEVASSGLRKAVDGLDTGWDAAVPAATWWTKQMAPLSRRAAGMDLVSVAAGIAVAALAALVISMVAQIEWVISPMTSPLWLTMGAALLAGAVLGAWRGLLAVGLYLFIGLIGASWRPEGVEHYLDGPWAGVLLSLPLGAFVAGWISSRHATLRSVVTSSWYFFGWFFVGALAGVGVVYAGALWTLFDRSEVTAWAAFVTMSARFPFDVLQCVLVAAIAAIVHRMVPGLLRSKRSPRRIRH